LSATEVVRRLAPALELPEAARAAPDIEWLLDQLAGREFTVLAGALDEAVEPATIAT